MTQTSQPVVGRIVPKQRVKGWLNLDQQLQYGKLKIETSPAPMEGIFILRDILAADSNHVRDDRNPGSNVDS